MCLHLLIIFLANREISASSSIAFVKILICFLSDKYCFVNQRQRMRMRFMIISKCNIPPIDFREIFSPLSCHHLFRYCIRQLLHLPFHQQKLFQYECIWKLSSVLKERVGEANVQNAHFKIPGAISN